MDYNTELQNRRDELKRLLCDYHNSVFRVCNREQGNWDEANKALLKIIDLQTSIKELHLKNVEQQLEDAFSKIDLDKYNNGTEDEDKQE